MTTAETVAAEATPAPIAEATPAREWGRRGEGLYRLPGSGHVARLRRPSLIALAAAGAVPNPISQDVLRYLTAKESGRPQTEEARIAEYRRNAKAFIEIAARCLVEPVLWLPPTEVERGKGAAAKTSPDYDAGEIGPEDLADSDYTWLYFTFVMEGEALAATFRVG